MPVQEHTLEVNGHQIACQTGGTDGSGYPVVFLHGITMSVRLWPAVIDHHALAGRRWVSIGLPGHYPSVAPTDFSRNDVQPELFADVVAAVNRELLGNEPMHLVGWSTGGFAALATAALHPQRVVGVTSICGFARGKWGNLLGWMQRLAGNAVGRLVFRAAMRLVAMRKGTLKWVLQRLAAKPLKNSAQFDAVLETVYEDFRRHNFGVMATLFAGLRRTSIAERLPQVQAPVRIIAGEKDTVIPYQESQFLADNLPVAELITIPDVGHIFAAEALETVLDSTLEWIQRHDGEAHQPVARQAQVGERPSAKT